MAETFGSFVLERLRSKGMALREYARVVMGHDRSHGFVSRVLRGISPPPLKALDDWAAPLGLDAEERKRFDFLAAVQHSPPAVREWFAENGVEAGGARRARR